MHRDMLSGWVQSHTRESSCITRTEFQRILCKACHRITMITTIAKTSRREGQLLTHIIWITKHTMLTLTLAGQWLNTKL